MAENVGIDKGDIPDLTKAPSSLLDALEGHLASLEGKKGSAANTPTQTARWVILLLGYKMILSEVYLILSNVSFHHDYKCSMSPFE